MIGQMFDCSKMMSCEHSAIPAGKTTEGNCSNWNAKGNLIPDPFLLVFHVGFARVHSVAIKHPFVSSQLKMAHLSHLGGKSDVQMTQQPLGETSTTSKQVDWE